MWMILNKQQWLRAYNLMLVQHTYPWTESEITLSLNLWYVQGTGENFILGNKLNEISSTKTKMIWDTKAYKTQFLKNVQEWAKSV